jgi:hypothetical protein
MYQIFNIGESVSDKKEVGRLILKDLALLNEAAVFFETEMQPEIQDEFSQIISRWVEQNHEWVISNEQSEFIWDIFKPDSWLSVTRSEWTYETAWFYFGWLDSKESQNYALADFFGISAGGKTGFGFNINTSAFGGAKKWKSSLGQLSSGYIEKLKEFGFIFESDGRIDTFKLPVKFDLEKLVFAWENDDYEDVFKPLIDALNILEKTWTIFDDLIQQVKILTQS